MKNILIPTDFSACATNAMQAAFQFSNYNKVSYLLYHQLDLPANWEQLEETEKTKYPELNQKVRNTEVLFKGIKEEYPDLPIQGMYAGGKLQKSLEKMVQENAIDLVVMGSHGSSGFNEFFLGSNTQKVVRQLQCPILIVKDKAPTLPFKKVIFASSFNPNEQAVFKRFLEFVQPFRPEIHLVSIHTSSFFDSPYILTKEVMKDFKAMAAPFNCEIHIYRDFSIEKGIRTFAEEIGADIIAISNQNKTPLMRMLSGSNVEALVNHSNVPVLSINF